NANGLQDDGELGLADVTVNLLDDQSNVIATTQTDSNGDYTFNDVSLGQYQLEVVLPDDYLFSTQNVGDDDTLDSDVDPDTGLTSVYDVSSPQVLTGISAGLYQLGSISGVVWEDRNHTQLRDDDDWLIEGTTVELYDQASQLLATTVSAADGSYLFEDITPGSYYVKFYHAGQDACLPNYGDNAYDDVDSDTSLLADGYSFSDLLNITSGQNFEHIDFGQQPAGGFSFRVWIDVNANGLYDQGEYGVDNVPMLLEKVDGTYSRFFNIGSPNVGTQGILHLTGGDYVITTEARSGLDRYGFTFLNTGDDSSIDNDIDPQTLTYYFTIEEGQFVENIGFGLVELAAIDGTVWDDLNADGIQDQNEPAVAGQTVNLLDDQGLVVDSTVTNTDGQYQFVNQLPGDYQVQFVTDGEYAFTWAQQGDDTNVDSDADRQYGVTSMFSLSSTQQIHHIDAGLVLRTTAHSGFYTINEGESLSLDASATQTYDAQAQYAWDLDEDGQYDDAYGTQPTLTWEEVQNLGLPTDGSTSTIRVQVTDVSGITHDTGTLTINNVAPVVDPGNAYAVGYGLTVQLNGNATDVSSDSLTYAWDLDGDGIFGETGADALYGDEVGATPVFNAAGLAANTAHTIKLAVTDDVTTITEQTAVMVGGASSIGDRIWLDLNADNVQDENEPGMAGVTVKLYSDPFTVMATTTTDADGNYLFNNLVTGEYHVEVVAPEDYGFTPVGTYNYTIEGSGDIIISLDSFDQSGDQSTVAGIAITSSSSQTVFAKSSAISLGIDEQIDTVDVGLYQPASISGTTWQDLNGDDIHDANDQVLPGITVFLDEDANGLLDWTDTNANEQWDAGEGEMWAVSSDLGEYSFTNLLPGTYTVSQQTPVNYQLVENDGFSFGGSHTTLVSMTNDGVPGNDISWYPDISGDGRYIVYETEASNLHPGAILPILGGIMVYD
ncbi:MAG: SdrD B-like domain-containing protein, partial [Phycisphaeraceae bacterium JB051]